MSAMATIGKHEPSTVAGPVLFARYAYGPNSLGYCGPAETDELFGEATSGFDTRALSSLAKRFEGAYPYLELIARANGIADPLDARVVDAYWLGNELVAQVPPRLLGESLDDRFRRRLRRDSWRWLAEKPGHGALPVHAFHVLDVFPRLGLMRSGAIDGAMEIMDSCRIRWGRVLERNGDSLVVSSQGLELHDGRLRLAPAQAHSVRAWRDGAGLLGGVADVAQGDLISIHWDWACEVLSPARAVALRYWTERQIAITNLTI